MSRKSATAIAASRKPEGRQPLWEEMVKFKGAPFTIAEIFSATDVNRRTIRSYLEALVAGNYAERIEPEPDATGADAAIRFRITVIPAPYHAPRLNRKGEPVTQGAGVENMWRTMQKLKEFTPRDIAAHATTDVVNVSDATAQAYCRALMAVGYLRVVEKAVAFNHQATYRLIENTGPLPPMIQRTKQVFDPNTKKAFPVGGAS